jgi:phospholipid transport system substrate-binding protein
MPADRSKPLGLGSIGQLLRLGLLALACLAFEPTFAHAQAAEPAKQVIAKTVDQAFAILRDASLKRDAKLRMRKLREVVDRVFDWGAMAQSSLGAPWRKLDEAQRAEFVAVFKELLAQRYMDDIDRFEGSEQVQIKGSDEQADFATVWTVLITSSRDQVPIDYTLHKTAAGWRVDDVSIERVSLVNHYRKSFARFLTNKSFAELMQQLKRKLGMAGGAPAVP